MGPAEPRRVPFPLARRLGAAVLAIAVLLAASLWLVLAPAARHALAGFGARTMAESGAAMRELTQRQTEASTRVLVDLIEQTTSARARALADLPLEVFGGDVDAMRRAVQHEDAQRSERQRRNVALLAEEVQRRADAEIAARLGEIERAQALRTDTFVVEQTRSYVLLVALAAALLLSALTFGVHRLVVRPVRRLRDATRRVAAGEPEVDLPHAAADEIGDLTRDFAAMLAQLRRSRAELQHLADNLEREVARQTAHLERAMADLADTHRQLAQAERLTALGTLAGGVAHEFHNLIGGIRGCVRELWLDEPDGERKETLAVVLRAAERGSGIVQQLQRFARQRAATLAPLDPAAVVEEALRLCEPAARRQRVQVVRKLPQGLSITADGDGLHQVFVNLFVNALQAMPDGGELRVELHPDEAGGVLASVADDGHGIPPEVLPHVFEPFFTTRADAAEPERRGSGLGLSVSYGIVAVHGGSLTVRSQPGAGATFVVRLPAVPPAPPTE